MKGSLWGHYESCLHIRLFLHTHTWKVTDARFAAKLGWHFLLDASGTGNDVLIREVKIGR